MVKFYPWKIEQSGFGNCVNRNFSYIITKFNGNVPNGVISNEETSKTINIYNTIGNKIADGELNNADQEMVGYIQLANKYYGEQNLIRRRVQC